jgi:hypothetical protein
VLTHLVSNATAAARLTEFELLAASFEGIIAA